jgi:tagatose 1,6-diphosphate aldolase
MFRFLNPGTLADDKLKLALVDRIPENPDRGRSPTYVFGITHCETAQPLGRIALRIGNSDYLTLYAGHIGYRVEEPFRGNRYAARACRLIFPLALRHSLNPLWITCNPENTPSRRTCELVGGSYVETVALPRDNDMYRIGERLKCRYRVDL